MDYLVQALQYLTVPIIFVLIACAVVYFAGPAYGIVTAILLSRSLTPQGVYNVTTS